MRFMDKIAVMGYSDSVVGFKALGLDVFPVDDVSAAKKTLQSLVKQSDDVEYGIIYIEETIAAGILDEIARYKDRLSPAIILIPGRDGPVGLGQNALKEAVEKAVGSDIL